MKTATYLSLLMVLVGCSGDEKLTPTPAGPPEQELILPGAPVLLAAGDIAVCGKKADESTAAIVDSVLQAASSAGLATAALTLGDNAYPSASAGPDNDLPLCFAPSWGSARIMSVIHPTPGNHDYDSGTPTPYFDFFGARAGPQGKGFYSYDFGEWHLISLNSELYFEHGNDAAIWEQEGWLRDDLARHRALCSLAYFHRPLFGSGTYGGTPEMRRLWEILYDGGVDLILNGHEHDYERFLPQTPAGETDSQNGIEEIVTGTGGAELRSVRNPAASNSAAQIQGHFGVLKLMLGSGEYRHAFLDTEGRIWDPGGRKCH